MKNTKAMKSNVTYVRPPWLLSILFLFPTIICSNQTDAQRQNLILESTFEGSLPFAGFQYGNQFCCNYSVTQSSAFARAGTSSVKFDLRRSDPVVSSSVRAEIEPTGTAGASDQEMERWYGLSYYLVNYGYDDGAESILQWHDVDGTCPPLSIQVASGRLRLQQCINNTNTPNDLGPVVSNQWFDIVIHVKWTNSNTGILQLWKDGVLVVNKSNVRTNSSGGSYMKVGINKWTWAPPASGISTAQSERVFYIDEFRMGNANATYADVAPSSTAPPPGNQPPTANAGNNITLTLPANSTTLNGSGTDTDGNIQTYAWTRVSGPTTYTMGTAGSASTSLSNLVAGTYVFRLTVTDNGGATATDDVTVLVNPAPNQLPTASAGNDITLTLPANSTALNGSGNDPDGNIQTYAWARVSGPTTYTLGTPGSASTSLSNLVAGTYVFRLTVTDNNNATATDNITVLVNPAPNQAPVARAGNDMSTTLPIALVTLDGSASSDPDGFIQSYSWSRVSGPTTFSLLTPLSAVSIVNSLIAGTYVFRLTVTDNNGVSSSDDISVVVNPLLAPNQPPVVNAGNDRTLVLPANSTTLQGTAADADGTIASYTWAMISGPRTYTFADSTLSTTGLTNLVQGTYVFSFKATDDDGASAIDYVTITVNAPATSPNQSPAANAGNDITLTLPANSTTLTGSGIDPDGNIQTYAWSKISGPTTFTLGTPNQAITTLSNLVQGTYVFRLTVTDNGGATASAFVTVTVNPAPPPPNQPPTANAGSDITLTLPINYTTLNGSGTDPDNNIASYAWTRISGPTTFNLANANAASTALTNLVQGAYVFRLTVTDAGGLTATAFVTVTVNPAPPPPNQPPTANAGNDITITLPTNTTTLTGSGADVDGTIRFAWTRVSGPTTFAFANATASSTGISNLVQGTYVFRLTVTDDDGVTATDDVTVTVNPAPIPNQPPVARAGNDIVMTLPTNSTTLNGSASTDADGRITAYAWTRISGPATYSFANAGAATNVVSGLVQGTYVFRLTVTDNSGATATDDISVVVNAAQPPPVNLPPVANAGADIVITLPDNTAVLYGTGSTDPDGVIASYEWQEISGPSQLVIVNRLSSSLQLSELMIGEYIFELKVTDNNNASSTARVKVIVKTKTGEGLYCNVYPNPASSNLNIQYAGNNTGKVRLTVYDANFRYILRELVVKDQATLSTSIDVSSYKPGTYFLELILSGNKKIVRKFVKL